MISKNELLEFLAIDLSLIYPENILCSRPRFYRFLGAACTRIPWEIQSASRILMDFATTYTNLVFFLLKAQATFVGPFSVLLLKSFALFDPRAESRDTVDEIASYHIGRSTSGFEARNRAI